MTVRYLLPLPQVTEVIQWTGDNFQEVSDFVSFRSTLVDNGDGSLTSGEFPQPEAVLPSGSWIDRAGSPVNTSYYQEVPSLSVQYVTE